MTDTSHPFYAMTVEMLKKFGDLYTFDDVVERIKDGRMQSFARGETWAVTQVNEYPRRKVLDLVFVVGDLDVLESMEQDILDFARQHECSLIMANGRMGWLRKKFEGWKAVSCMFVKEV